MSPCDYDTVIDPRAWAGLRGGRRNPPQVSALSRQEFSIARAYHPISDVAVGARDMANRIFRYVRWVCGAGTLLAAGCDVGFVGQTAQQSLASFLNTVISNAVTAAIVS